MSKTPGTRVRVALASLAAIGLAMAAASPALADTATPVTPTKLLNGNQVACATDASAPLYWNTNEGLEIEGAPTLSDGSLTSASIEYQLWPVSDPTDFSSWSLDGATNIDAPLTVPSSDFTNGQTYAWDAATVADDGATSAFSAPCYVTVENTPPASAPTVTSSNYPADTVVQGGTPVHVTFGANGASDIVGYIFGWMGDMSGSDFNGPLSDPYVGSAGSEPVSTLGGSATLDLVPASPSDVMYLTVASVDQAGNESPRTTYWIYTKSTAPTVTLQDKLPGYGTPSIYDLTPNAALEAQSPVVSYNVQVVGDPNGQQDYTVAARKNGTAQTQITLYSTTGEWVQVSSVSADGWVSDLGDYTINTEPTVSSNVYAENGTGGGVGVTSTFTFAPPVKDVASYSYSFDYGTTQTIVKAHGGTARLSWTPTASGSYDIEVYAILKDGTELYPYDYFFNVA